MINLVLFIFFMAGIGKANAISFLIDDTQEQFCKKRGWADCVRESNNPIQIKQFRIKNKFNFKIDRASDLVRLGDKIFIPSARGQEPQLSLNNFLTAFDFKTGALVRYPIIIPPEKMESFQGWTLSPDASKLLAVFAWELQRKTWYEIYDSKTGTLLEKKQLSASETLKMTNHGAGVGYVDDNSIYLVHSNPNSYSEPKIRHYDLRVPAYPDFGNGPRHILNEVGCEPSTREIFEGEYINDTQRLLGYTIKSQYFSCMRPVQILRALGIKLPPFQLPRKLETESYDRDAVNQAWRLAGASGFLDDPKYQDYFIRRKIQFLSLTGAKYHFGIEEITHYTEKRFEGEETNLDWWIIPQQFLFERESVSTDLYPPYQEFGKIIGFLPFVSINTEVIWHKADKAVTLTGFTASDDKPQIGTLEITTWEPDREITLDVGKVVYYTHENSRDEECLVPKSTAQNIPQTLCFRRDLLQHCNPIDGICRQQDSRTRPNKLVVTLDGEEKSFDSFYFDEVSVPALPARGYKTPFFEWKDMNIQFEYLNQSRDGGVYPYSRTLTIDYGIEKPERPRFLKIDYEKR